MYYLSECLIIKNENRYLLEHLDKNAKAGISHFYIYDNCSDESVSEFIKNNAPEWIDKCTIELFATDGDDAQFECYNKFLNDHREETKWCAFFDTDEICEGNLRKLCRDNEDYLSLRIRQVIHGSNGHKYDSNESMTERFKPHVIHEFSMHKIVSQVKYVTEQFQHHCKIHKDNTDMKYYMKYVYPNDTFELHHYYFKSFEEWIKKIKRGSCLKLSTHWDIKRFFIENKISEDDKINLMNKYNVTDDTSMDYAGNKSCGNQ